jgi:hypothetical protein
MADDYHVLLANSAHPTDVVSDGITAALAEKVKVVPFVKAEDLPTNTAVKLFRKDGSVTGETISEAGAYSYSANGEVTQSSVSATAIKTCVCTKITVEGIQFGTISEADIPAYHSAGIGRALDDEIVALFSGFTGNTLTCTSTLTAEDILQGAYKVNASYCARDGQNLVGFFDYKGVYEILKQLVQAGGTAFANESQISLLKGASRNNGYRGSLPGVDIYETDGLPTTGSDDQALVFNPDLAFGGMYGPSVQTWRIPVGSSGFHVEYASWLFHKVIEWNDTAGACIRSDT